MLSQRSSSTTGTRWKIVPGCLNFNKPVYCPNPEDVDIMAAVVTDFMVSYNEQCLQAINAFSVAQSQLVWIAPV